jgi:hypothetical protein
MGPTDSANGSPPSMAERSARLNVRMTIPQSRPWNGMSERFSRIGKWDKSNIILNGAIRPKIP